MIGNLAQALGPWTWVILGLLLFGLELLAPGAFFLWLGAAALLTGLVDAVFGLSWQAALLVFVGLSVGSVLLGRAIMRRGEPAKALEPVLNRRAESLVGRVFVLEHAIAGGEGRVRVDDSSWRVTGPDAPAGARVRVVRVEGATLVAEAA